MIGRHNTLRGPMLQRGRGLGGIFSSLLRTLGPTVQTIGRSSLAQGIGDNIMTAASNGGLAMIGDVLAGENVLKSAKKNFLGIGDDDNDAAKTVKRHQTMLKQQQQRLKKKKSVKKQLSDKKQNNNKKAKPKKKSQVKSSGRKTEYIKSVGNNGSGGYDDDDDDDDDSYSDDSYDSNDD